MIEAVMLSSWGVLTALGVGGVLVVVDAVASWGFIDCDCRRCRCLWRHGLFFGVIPARRACDPIVALRSA